METRKDVWKPKLRSQCLLSYFLETGRTNREPLTLLFKPLRNHFGGATSEIESLNHQAEQTERLGCWIEEDSVIMQI